MSRRVDSDESELLCWGYGGSQPFGFDGKWGVHRGHFKDVHSVPVNHHHSHFTMSDISIMRFVAVISWEAKPILTEYSELWENIFIQMWHTVSVATPPTVIGTIHLDLLTFFDRAIGCRVSIEQCLTQLWINPHFPHNIFGSSKTKTLSIYRISHPCSTTVLLLLLFVRERRNVVALLMLAKTDCPFFLIYFTETAFERHSRRHLEPWDTGL